MCVTNLFFMKEGKRSTGSTFSRAAGSVLRAVGGPRGVIRLARKGFHMYSRREQKSARAQLKRGSTRYRRVKKRRRRTLKDQKMVKRLQRKVDKLCLSNIMATHVRRQRRVSRVCNAVRNADYSEFADGGSIGEIETAMSSLRYFDPATNAMVVANPATGTYSRDMCISIFRKILCRNNYHVPVNITVYSCVPKVDTSLTPISLYESGLVDQGNPDKNSTMVHFSDSFDLKNVWKLTGTKRVLNPGESMVVKAITPEFKYTFSTNDQHNLSFQKDQGGHVFLVRVAGVLGHDSTVAGQVSLLSGCVDTQRTVTYTFKYDAGKDVHDYSIDDTAPTAFTNAGVVSQRPLAGQQHFKI